MFFNGDNLNSNMISDTYENIVWDDDTGMSSTVLFDNCMKIASDTDSRKLAKAKIIAYILENARLEISENAIFADKLDHGDIVSKIRDIWKEEAEREISDVYKQSFKDSVDAYAISGSADLSHTAPDWSFLMKNGIVGILERLESAAASDGLTESKREFYDSCIIVYRAFIIYVKRLSALAKKLGKQTLCAALESLSVGAPQNMYEALELTLLYYRVHHYLDGVNLRSLGGLDRLYYPFFKNDLACGRYTEAEIAFMLECFYKKLNAIHFSANIPFYICGTDDDGNAYFNLLSELLIDVYIKLGLPDPKIHVRYHRTLPKAFILKLLDAMRKGINSIVFINDEVAENSLIALGETPEDARHYIPIGCYEPAAEGKELPCTCAGIVNLAQVTVCTLFGGNEPLSGKHIGADTALEFDSFDKLFDSFKIQLAHFTAQCAELVILREGYFGKINPSPVLSATFSDSVRRGVDVYEGGAKYNNSSICVIGIANAVDSLLSLKHSVFIEKSATLDDIRRALLDNFQNQKELFINCKYRYPKYGNGIEEADDLYKELFDFSASLINKRPNKRGGVFRAGFFSINWGIEYGRHVIATPDGRHFSDPLSKNTSPCVGADKCGITALLKTVCAPDYSGAPDGAVFDIQLHSSACAGEDGLSAMHALFEYYLTHGGFAIHGNVLNASILRKAQQDPEAYQTLQVRLCGWNVYFVDLSRTEQDEFIAIADSMVR